MQSLWNDREAEAFASSDLDMRVYTSRLLGSSPDLVLHGGGNTSVKVTQSNLFGETEDILYVKGSGSNLKTIGAEDFSPTRLEYLRKLGSLASMTDAQIARELKASQINPDSPAPSVEAILHASIPHKFVDHTHTDAVVAISNTPDGDLTLQDLFSDRVLILPYIMPGFALARQVIDATQGIDWSTLDGIFLLRHGLFTFGNDPRTSYENHINLVTMAEALLHKSGALDTPKVARYHPTADDCLALAALRQTVSHYARQPMLAQWMLDEHSVGYSSLENVMDLATRGPLTPDHAIHTKGTAAILDAEPLQGVHQFAAGYKQYFDRHADEHLTCLDTAPRIAIWRNRGILAFGQNCQGIAIVSDIAAQTVKAVQWSESLGGWDALPEQDIFHIEYWELEQAKLRQVGPRPIYEGRVVLVTGAASGIGMACVSEFLAQGACVVGLDINPDVQKNFVCKGYLGLVCDVTVSDQITAAIEQTVREYGGLDIVVTNAGAFPQSQPIAEISDDSFEKSLALNLNSHVSLIREATPYLKLGIDPSIIIVASKNVPAPGPGAGAYSAAKAALTQIGRVAALEMGEFGIRVNTLHPNAVFDTAVWSDDVLEQRAKHYGLSVDQYKRNNVLKTEISSADVARLAATMAGSSFSKTTGAQLPIDGGNERVI
ncbi:MAG: bifunctional aldolase/short-chain dehydrogenase [Halieaceae bacterium]|jgi:rhamnose utilization protein RhaD (predicted bifunctional aldolase and dehydrogenase)/NAD(P)-dependent dehydrogenase (short-subunit alcohol dehydrogenase family)|nr:bifunctional aldolase/short-chain dehydrogenase [Halieaceae bacterium]